VDLTKLTLGDKVVAGSGFFLFVFSLFTWFDYSVKAGFLGGSVASETGWDYFFTGTVPALLGLVLLGYVVATKLFDVKLPDLPVAWPLVVLGVAALAALLVVLRLLLGAQYDGNAYVTVSRGFGLYLATLAALGLAGGAFLKFNEDGGEFPNKG
jgi:Na+/glutamate symporter